MKFYSTNNRKHKVSFKEAVINRGDVKEETLSRGNGSMRSSLRDIHLFSLGLTAGIARFERVNKNPVFFLSSLTQMKFRDMTQHFMSFVDVNTGARFKSDGCDGRSGKTGNKNGIEIRKPRVVREC